jgi:hypothetical protein
MWKKIKYNISKFIIKLFGDVQFFPAPMFCLFWGNTQYKVKGKEAREIIDDLQRGDIILTRFDRYVSSWFIPGYYTHVALYIGDNKVIHAVTKGVLEEDILSLLRTDHVCVLRFKEIDPITVRVATNTAITLVGRDYDFLFESNDASSLYCSEIVKKVYSGYFHDLGVDEAISPDEYKAHPKLRVVHESKRWRNHSRQLDLEGL